MTVVKDLFRFSSSFRWGALFLLVVLILVGLSFVSPYGPLDRRVVPNNRPPSARFLLGTISLGRFESLGMFQFERNQLYSW